MKKRFNLKPSLVAFAVLQVLSLHAQSASAATVIVDNLGDDGTGCTLREAIERLNIRPSGPPPNNGCLEADVFGEDIINFSEAALLGQTLSLISGSLTVNNNASLTINGPADSSLVIDAGKASNLITVSRGQLTLNHFTLQNGSASQGGAVSLGGIVELNNCTVTGNTARLAGGGVFAGEGKVVLRQTLVSNNIVEAQTTGKGGGLYGLLEISDSVISNNSAALGGGVYAKGGNYSEKHQIANSQIVGNSARIYGGGVYQRYGVKLYLDDSSMSDNTAGFSGGAIFVRGSPSLSVNNSNISANVAGSPGIVGHGRGAGILSRNSRVSIRSSTLNNNSGQGAGGGVNAITNSTVDILSSTISNNTAGLGAGVEVTNDSVVTLRQSTVTGNVSDSGSGSGLFANVRSTMNIENSLVVGNQPSEVASFYTEGFTTSGINFVGHNTLTTAQAVDGRATLGPNDLSGTTDGTNPTSLNRIIRTNLANNGGPTRTHALPASSPAIGTADGTNCGPGLAIEFDQRGEPRDEQCDIGAVEFIDDESCFVVPSENGKAVVFCL